MENKITDNIWQRKKKRVEKRNFLAIKGAFAYNRYKIATGGWRKEQGFQWRTICAFA